MIDLKNLTIENAHKGMKSGAFTCRELVEEYLKVIKEKNPELNIYLEVFEDATAQADVAQKKFTEGTATTLTGIPFAIKDNMLFMGHKVSAGSKILENYKATYNATVVEKLKSAGAVILGRANMDEFAMGSSTENSAYGVTKNPYDSERVAGGSSGGPACAVAVDGALFALGTDTGSSIRQPASFCGVVGLYPTYGSVSRFGIIAMGNSLDQVGPLAKNVRDTEIVFNALSGYDLMDATSIPDNFRAQIPSEVKRVGVPRHLLKGEGIDLELMENFEKSLTKLKSAGYEIVDIEMPYTKYSLPVYYIIMPAEVSTNLARFDGIRYGFSSPGKDLMEVYKKSRGHGFGREPRRRILLGAYVLSHGYYDAYYNKANKIRSLIINDFDNAFQKVDVIAMPTSPFPPFKIGEKSDDPLAMYFADIFTVPANVAGVPAISIPNSFTKTGLPLDMQFIAPKFGENRLFEIGKKFETIR
jgi:aspartyl-tRNA(Asn)/glutamyl-tRNA(Gln) amidotransferase subunit A